MNENLTQLIKEARLTKNMKQLEVAEKLGVKKNTISNWENGKANPDIETFVKLCSIYEVDFAKLLEKAYSVERELMTLNFSFKEAEHIKKYRTLDEGGKQTVDAVLKIQYDLIVAKKETTADEASQDEPEDKIDSMTRKEVIQAVNEEFDAIKKETASGTSSFTKSSADTKIG